MRIIDIINSPWAVTPRMLTEIQNIYATHLRGEKINIRAIEAAIGKTLDNKRQAFEIVDGVAIIPVEGVIAKKMNLFTQVSGGVSSELLQSDIQTALDDPDVKSIILKIDSPGGTVDGTAEIAEFIFKSRGTKPIVSFSDGMIASAAYWIASATDQIFISSDIVDVGSIGVVASHVDISKAEELAGIKTTEIFAGKFKRIAGEHEPLSDEGRATIQEHVDYIYTVFVNAVTKHRGISTERALGMADGKIFIGKQTIDIGLVDGMSTLDELINNLNSEVIMTKEELKEKHPNIYQAVVLEAEQGMRAEIEKAVAEARDGERKRILGIEALSVPGHEALIESLKADGKTEASEAAMLILQADKKVREKILADMKADGSVLLNIPATEPGMAHMAVDNLSLEERAKAEWDKSEELRAEFGDNYNAYLAYMKNDKAGNIKLYRKMEVK